MFGAYDTVVIASRSTEAGGCWSVLEMGVQGAKTRFIKRRQDPLRRVLHPGGRLCSSRLDAL